MNDNIEVTTERCACGCDFKMKGWRVCLTCAQARLLWQDGFTDDPPDKIDGEDGATVDDVANAW